LTLTNAPIRIETTGAVARVTLNRPEKRNAIDEQMIAELRSALESVSRETDVRVVLLAAEGPDFCTGMDLGAMAASAASGALEFLESARRLADLYRAFRDHPQPVVAAVRGRALGGGCGLAMACDAILAAESAHFGFPEVNIGFVPAIVMSLLRRSVGEKRAFELLVFGEPVHAREACDMGMVTRVYSDSDFDLSVAAYVATLAAKSASAVGLTKKLLYQIDGMSFEAALDSGTQVNAIARTTADARRGFEQFGKRKR
jgi:methylglutaconyl-CoA hydratase